MAEITINDGKWLISGDLLLEDIERLLAQGVVVDGAKKLEIDMSGVLEVDSVAISLLFQWLRQARDQQCDLTYSHLPPSLTSLATLYGILDFIPQAANHAASH